LGRSIFIFFLTILCFGCKSIPKSITVDVSQDLVSPKTYVVYKAHQAIIIDGKDEEAAWQNTDFTSKFIDIEGIKVPHFDTKVKMLWDKDYLYVYAILHEKHIWGDITQRDAVIFYNNDFEVFISPSNDTHNYGEVEINTLGTVWDLVLNKPYNVGGKPKNKWNLDNLKSAVHIQGTLNNPSDEDEYWSVEMAIPLDAYAELKNRPKIKPKDGEQWRINFSRVQWDHDIIDRKYSRKRENGKFLKEYNWVWSNQGAINMHLPENWGYIHFSDNDPTEKIEFKHQTNVFTEQIFYALFRKIAFKDLKHLQKEAVGFQVDFEPIVINSHVIKASFLKTHTGFTITAVNTQKNVIYTINETGLIKRRKFYR